MIAREKTRVPEDYVRTKKPARKQEPNHERGMVFKTRFDMYGFMDGRRSTNIGYIDHDVEDGLWQINELAEIGDTVSPILVDVSDMMEITETTNLGAVFQNKHPYWRDLPRAAIFHYPLCVCEKHLRVLREGDVILFMMTPILFGEGKRMCVPAMERLDTYTGFRLKFHRLHKPLNGREKILCHREPGQR